MEELYEGQPDVAAEAPSEDTALEAAGDPEQAEEGAGEGQPSEKKWARMFDSPEKLEEAYGHIYRAYHSKCRELQQTTQALEGLFELVSQGMPPQSAAPATAGAAPFTPGASAAPVPSGGEMALIQAVLQAQAEAQQARQMGEKFLRLSLEGQMRGFFNSHPELGTGEKDYQQFADEVSELLGDVDTDALERMPGTLERALRIVSYPDAMLEAQRRREREEEEAGRFEVEGGGAGTMDVPRNQARETSFRALVQRLKREAGLA